MARYQITVLQPKPDATKSIEVGTVTKTAISTPANGAAVACKFDANYATNGKVLEGALQNKNNSLVIYVEATTNSSGTAVKKNITIKAGNEYPNKILGDLTYQTNGGGAIEAIILEDISRFENRDGSINIDFESGFTGNVWAVAKRAGVQPKADQA